MILDTTAATVTFDAKTTLGLEELQALITLLEGGLSSWERELLAIPEPPKVVALLVVPSQSDYRVSYNLTVYSDGTLECSCPDFQHRGFHDGERVPGYECKHIRGRNVWQ